MSKVKLLLKTTLMTYDFSECTLTMWNHKILGIDRRMKNGGHAKVWLFKGQQHMGGKSQTSKESSVCYFCGLVLSF